MIVTDGWLAASVLVDEPRASYAGIEVRTARWKAQPSAAGAGRAVVELRRPISGHPQRALLGATFKPGGGTWVIVELALSGAMSLGRKPTCPSQLGRSLVPGLPDEFAEPVFAGLDDAQVLLAGKVVLDRAAYDEVASSGDAFRKAAELLAVAVTQPDAGVAAREMTARIRAWS